MADAPRNDLRITRNAGGWALLEIARAPVNSMDLQLWRQLTAALDELEADPQVGALGRAEAAAASVPKQVRNK